MTKVCISGYYGFDNVGDEAILLSIIQQLKKDFPDMEILVLSDKPEKTSATYGVEARDRWKWWQIHKSIMESDILISGGGGLLQDVTGKKSLLYYTNIMKMAKRRKRPVFVFSQGIGPVDSEWGQKNVVKALRKATKITVRDEESAKMLHSWGLRKGRIRVTADPVLMMEDTERHWDVERFVETLKAEMAKVIATNDVTEIEICIVDDKSLDQLIAEKAQGEAAAKEGTGAMNAAAFLAAEEKNDVAEADIVKETQVNPEVETEVDSESEDGEIEAEEVKEPVLSVDGYGIVGLHPSLWKKEDERLAIFSVRDWTNLPLADIAAAADLTVASGYKVVFLPFQYPNDIEISNKVVLEMKEEATVFNAKVPLTPQEILTVMDEADFVFGMRLHALILASITKTPIASLSYNPKVASFVKQLGLTATGDLNHYDSAAFLENMAGILENMEEVRETMEENLPDLIEKSESAMDSLHVLLDRIDRRNARKNMSQEDLDAIAARRQDEREKLMPLKFSDDETDDVAQEEGASLENETEHMIEDGMEEIETAEESFEDEKTASKE